MQDGCVYRGLRYSAYLRKVSPNAGVFITRNDAAPDDSNSWGWTYTIRQRIPTKIFGITVGHETRSLTKIVELAISKIEEYDAVLETFEVEKEGEEE